MPRNLPLCLLLLPFVTTSCTRPSDVLDNSEKSIHSWSATLRLTTEQWASHRIPDTYFRQVLKAADEEISQQRQKLAKVPSSDTDRASLELQLIELHQHVTVLNEALEHSDREAARSAIPPDRNSAS